MLPEPAAIEVGGVFLATQGEERHESETFIEAGHTEPLHPGRVRLPGQDQVKERLLLQVREQLRGVEGEEVDDPVTELDEVVGRFDVDDDVGQRRREDRDRRGVETTSAEHADRPVGVDDADEPVPEKAGTVLTPERGQFAGNGFLVTGDGLRGIGCRWLTVPNTELVATSAVGGS